MEPNFRRWREHFFWVYKCKKSRHVNEQQRRLFTLSNTTEVTPQEYSVNFILGKAPNFCSQNEQRSPANSNHLKSKILFTPNFKNVISLLSLIICLIDTAHCAKKAAGSALITLRSDHARITPSDHYRLGNTEPFQLGSKIPCVRAGQVD